MVFALAAATLAHRWVAPAGLAEQDLIEGTLLVRGEANLPAGEMAWRVVQDVAEVGKVAMFQQRALGFTVNSGIFSDLLLTDEATGSAYRLAPGEAAFVGEGTMQRRESLSSGAEQYLRIALVQAAHAGDAGGDRLVFSGPGFSAPAGTDSLTLERLDLNEGDRAHAGTGVGQVLILVLQGEIEIEEGEAGPRTRLETVVGSGTSYAAHSTPWGTAITALRDATYVLLASMQ
ncbi:MAG: hypothetical protein JNM64_00230 [Chloroflexia bacterium]|nr:hypothetical protein [Chloroflexia bacterium]